MSRWWYVIATNGIVVSRHTSMKAAQSAWARRGWGTVKNAEILQVPPELGEDYKIKVGQRIWNAHLWVQHTGG